MSDERIPPDAPEASNSGLPARRRGMSLAEISLRRPVTVMMFFLSLIVIGLIASQRLPLAFLPEIQAPFIFVDIPYPGSTPEEVERTIIRPVEEALSTLSGVKRMNSQARADGGFVFLEFSWNRDIEVVASEARERVDAIRGDLPEDLQRYFVMKFATSDQPVLRVRFATDRDLSGSYELLEREIKRRIERLPGVARVDISGVAPAEVEIAVSSDRVAAHGLSLNVLAQRLQAANFSVSAGEIDDGTRRLRVQPVGELASLAEVRGLVLDERGTRLEDIAEVQFKPSRLDYGRRLEGRPAVGIDIFKERNANLVDVGRAVLAELDPISKRPELDGISFTIIENQARGVTESLTELASSGLIGMVLAVLVLFGFLRHWPSTLMVATAIPVAIIVTLGIMQFLGLSLNILSMMGLLLAVGMLVDNAVVVTESIYQYREKYPGNPWRAAIEGSRSVQLAITAGTLTSVIVFLPNIFGERNQISLFLSHVAVTITISMLVSWLIAVSLIPMLSARIASPPSGSRGQGLIHWLQVRYAGALDWSLRHRGWSVLGIVMVIALSMLPATGTQFDMFSNESRREFDIQYRWKSSYPLEQLSGEVRRIETYLDEHRERFGITQIYSWYSERGWAATRVTLADDAMGGETPAKIQEQIVAELPRLATAELILGQQQRGSGSGAGVEFFLQGDSAETLRELSESLVPMLASYPELRDVRADLGDENKEVKVSVDRDRAALYGFTAEEVANYVGIALRGTPLREFRADGKEVPMWLRFADSESQSIADLSRYTLQKSDGSAVPLMAVVEAGIQRGPSQINRQNRRTSLAIQANLAEGVLLPDARKTIETAMAEVSLPPGYAWSFGQSFQENDDAGARMGFNTLIALLMIFVVMAALFESLLFPAAILSGILFSALGVFWLFWLTGTTFSIMAAIGILVLMGVVVNNGIVMIEHINNLRREGMQRTEALVAGGRERLRPILMTVGTTLLGLIPLSLSATQLGGDGPAYYPMARAIAGGLLFSTVVSLLFLPTIYAILDDLRLWTSHWLRRALARVPFAGKVQRA